MHVGDGVRQHVGGMCERDRGVTALEESQDVRVWQGCVSKNVPLSAIQPPHQGSGWVCWH